MNGKTFAAVLAVLATIWGTTYMHDRNHRYDIVVTGAGGGASQEDTGDTKIHAYVIDHKTGKAWWIQGDVAFPIMQFGCRFASNGAVETDTGCIYPPAQNPKK